MSLMTDNAKRYNEPKSIIYKDACKIKRLTMDTYKELTSLISKGKLIQSTKSREKKHKLVEEISVGNGGPDETVVRSTPNEETPAANHNEEEDDEDEDDDEDDDDEELNESNEAAQTTVESKRPRRKNNHLMPTMWSLFDHMKEYRHANHVLMDPFVKLPSKRIYPDYYEEIKKPIALNVIKKKLNKRVYLSVKELVDDFELMFKNAMQYNLEESLIYKDAKRLLDVLHQKAAELPLLVSTSGPGGSGAPSPAVNTPRKSRQQQQQQQVETKEENSKYAVIPKFNDLKEKLIFLYNYILDFQIEKRDLAAPFRVLPARTEYPDYYTVIKKPIDMTKIWHKINQHNHANGYASLDEMCYDFAQMFENACIYNEPASKIYKDALSLQQAVFTKRDQIIISELSSSSLTSSNCFSRDPVNDFQNEIEFLKRNESLTSDFVQNAVQCLLNYLFECVITYQDLETRTLSDSFVELYNLYDKKKEEVTPEYILTFELVRQRLKKGVYKRLDVFQEDLFQVFGQVRTVRFDSRLVDENSQLYRDAYDLQRYFVTKRDELCRNGDLLQTNAVSFKLVTLDSQIASARGHVPHTFDETDLLLVEKRFRKLESQITPSNESDEIKYKLGHFYFIKKSLISEHLDEFKVDSSQSESLVCCVLSTDAPQTKLIVQIYLKPSDEEFIDPECLNTRKFFEREVFKSDLYALLDASKLDELKECFVVGVKEYMLNEPVYNEAVTRENLFICESIYSTNSKYFRKIVNKKWSPLAFINHTQVNSLVNMTRRSIPLTINRYFKNESFVNELTQRVDAKLAELSRSKQLFKELERQTVEYDSLPAALAASKEKEADELEASAQITPEDDPEVMKTAKYYEQLVYTDGELYRVGDYVYVRHQNESNKPPMIVRIDRLWSVQAGCFLRGALFLRPVEITHEPTRLFYKNEVFKEISREITANLDQIALSDTNTNSKKCIVLNAKKYASCRVTELDERDVYICETKYSLQAKTFRKFTKGLRKFELSLKCHEDEVYFLRRELQLKKHMSPVLCNLTINYDEEYSAPEIADYAMDANDSNEEDWSDGEGMMRDDENSSHSFNVNSAHFNENSNSVGSPSLFRMKPKLEYAADGTLLNKQKKVRVKRLKKSGYNLFSKDLRKRLRDTKSSLSFVNMSKEVGNRWRALSDQERASYEEKAKLETIKEQQAAAAAAAAANASHQSPQLQANIINNNQIYSQTNGSQTIYLQQTPNGLVAKQGPVVLQNQPVYQNGTQYVTQAVYQPVYEQAQPQMIQQVQAAPAIAQQAAPAQPPPPPPPPKQDHPKSVQHKEAYIKYIANMRKQQQLYQSNAVSASITGITPDWYNSIDIRSARIKESRVQPPSATWVESCNHGDVMKHLLSLRYYLLNDSINIEKYIHQDEDTETPTQPESPTTSGDTTNSAAKTNETQECMIVE